MPPEAQPRFHASAALISIGDELTLGQSLDTNSRWLADQLLTRGIITIEHATVPDDRAAIARAFRRLIQTADLIISTGGLGPTPDDLTRQALADALNEQLIEDPAALDAIESYFRARNRPMRDNNRIQAQRPQSAETLPNPNGTAPGIVIKVNAHPASSPSHPAPSSPIIFSLPGPPREMQPMFEREVLPRLNPPQHRIIRTHLLHTCGLGESEIAARLGNLMDRDRNPLVGTTASQGIVTCRIRCESSSSDIADELTAKAAAEIRQQLAPYIFSETDPSLARAIIELLRTRKRTLAVVESCTGGLLGASLTDIPGSSDVFLGGWITYTNESKMREVNIPAQLFVAGGPGAVSAQCALAMAAGGLARSGADDCLAITGIAGPGGGSTDKPVGTVWIAHASRAASSAHRFYFPVDRAAVRDWSVKSALTMLRLNLLGHKDSKLLGQQEVQRETKT